jgi:hypothetical protein
VDRRCKGIKQYKTFAIHVPKPDKNIAKAQRRKQSKRAAIGPSSDTLNKIIAMQKLTTCRLRLDRRWEIEKGKDNIKGIFPGSDIRQLMQGCASNKSSVKGTAFLCLENNNSHACLDKLIKLCLYNVNLSSYIK